MAYAWQKQADEEGAAAKIPAGEHSVRIIKVRHGNQSGPYQSKSGDPQIMLIFQDREAREATLMITLSDRAGWVLAKLLSCCDPPANLERMEADGVEPTHFADEQFADANLLNRQLRIHVEWESGSKYPNVTPIKPASTSPPATSEAPPSAPPTEPPPTADGPPSSSTPPLTREGAWALVIEAWQHVAAPDAKEQRNAKWLAAIRETGKSERELTSEEWAEVVRACSIPF